jgi:hypothetical protein
MNLSNWRYFELNPHLNPDHVGEVSSLVSQFQRKLQEENPQLRPLEIATALENVARQIRIGEAIKAQAEAGARPDG